MHAFLNNNNLIETIYVQSKLKKCTKAIVHKVKCIIELEIFRAITEHYYQHKRPMHSASYYNTLQQSATRTLAVKILQKT